MNEDANLARRAGAAAPPAGRAPGWRGGRPAGVRLTIGRE
jgi:hypothetical protein